MAPICAGVTLCGLLKSLRWLSISLCNSLITTSKALESCVMLSEVPLTYRAFPSFTKMLSLAICNLTSAESLSAPVPNDNTFSNSTTLSGIELSTSHSLIRVPTGILTTCLSPVRSLNTITSSSVSGSYLASSTIADKPI